LQFIAKKPRELKGPDTSGKYDYQKDVSICLLLEYHLKGDEYLFVFDYHDDLVIFNSEQNPSETNFFQIKGHDRGYYNLTQILRTKKLKEEKANSILGKLYGHLLDFKNEVKSLNFITNREFNIPIGINGNCNAYTEICLTNLNTAEVDRIKKKLSEEFKVTNIEPNFLNLTFLKVNNLSVIDSSTHTKGKLSEFLQTKFPGIKTNADLIYQNIFDEVKRKSKYDKIVTTFEELTRNKGIGRSYFTDMLSVIGATKDYDAIWNQISTLLAIERVKAGEIFQYRQYWKSLEVERMNPDNLVLKEAIKDASQAIGESRDRLREMNLMEIVSYIRPKLTRYEKLLKEPLITAIIFSKLYE